jgi:hypothetical protein
MRVKRAVLVGASGVSVSHASVRMTTACEAIR